MDRYVALLRGINVGGKNKLSMSDLARAFVAAGCSDVTTYIQSGNVVFSATKAVAERVAAVVQKRIEKDFGLRLPVVLRKAGELERLKRSNPFLRAGADPNALHVMFLAEVPAARAVSSLDAKRSRTDEFAVIGRDIFLLCPHGMGKSKLTNAYFDTKLQTTSTCRNWRTVLKLCELALLVAWIFVAFPLRAQNGASSAAPESVPSVEGHRPRPMAVGAQLDLFPTVVSAINGKLGYAPQVWLGIDHARLRLVGAHLEPPDALAFAKEGFKNPTTTAFAVLIDYTFGEHFDRWWLGTGFEQWTRSIQHDGVSGTARWQSTIFTFGGGYIWRAAGNFYLDIWAALHLTMDPETVTLGTYDYEPSPLLASGGLKLGYFFDL
jgi:uncharacterized protein (DUF1697 family)